MEFFVRACHLHFHNIGSQARFTLMQCGKRRELIRFRCDPNVFFMRFGYSCNLCLYLGMGGEEESKDLQKTYWNHVTLGQISALHVVSIQVHGATNHTALNPHRSLFKNASDFQCIYVNDLSRNVCYFTCLVIPCVLERIRNCISVNQGLQQTKVWPIKWQHVVDWLQKIIKVDWL